MKQFYTPQEPQMSPEEEAMIQQQMMQQQLGGKVEYNNGTGIWNIKNARLF